jgi:hypothetical protein
MILLPHKIVAAPNSCTSCFGFWLQLIIMVTFKVQLWRLSLRSPQIWLASQVTTFYAGTLFCLMDSKISATSVPSIHLFVIMTMVLPIFIL